MNIKDLVKALGEIEDNRMITNDIVVEALSEGLVKAYRKHCGDPDALVRVEIDTQDGNIKVFHQFKVVSEVMDDALEISVEDAQRDNPELKLDDFYEVPVDISEFGRSTVTLVKNVMLQKIKEASKQIVYDEYIDKLQDLVYGTVQSVEDKFCLVDLGKTLAMMPKSAQMPTERYVEGQRIRVVITDVTKDSKGAQVLVSRTDANLVKRLFEQEVPEIYQGIIEIKAIAREAGERTKMAVISHNPSIEPVGACIGPRGSRVNVVIDELKGEKIDIFEWSENLVELVKNALKPAAVIGVLPTEDERSLTVIVDESQLSLAIGKRGKNARLAVKLTGRKIDIKTKSEMEQAGVDVDARIAEYNAKAEAERQRKALKKLAEEEAKAVAERQAEREAEQARIDQQAAAIAASQPAEPEFTEEEEEPLPEEMPQTEASQPEMPEAETQTAAAAEETEEVKSEPEEAKPEVIKRRKAKLEIHADEYVSKYEKLADNKRAEVKAAPAAGFKKKYSKAKPSTSYEDEMLKKKLESLKQKDYEIKPEYSEEELAEIKNSEQEDKWYDDDVDSSYDDYDKYYDQDGK